MSKYQEATKSTSMFRSMKRFIDQLLWRCGKSLKERSKANNRKSRGRYRFDTHILILGCSGMLEGLLNAIARHSEWAGREVVVLSSHKPELVSNRVLLGLTPEARSLSMTCCFGNRTNEEDLGMCQVESASLVFIIGEDGENGHDALNYECWEKTRALRVHSTDVAQCYLFLENSATIGLFHKLPQEAHTSIETTIVNPYESMIQQLIEGDVRQDDHLSLDRGLVTADTDRYVHLVVVGMTSVGYAFATTAAQLCHFPNFDEASPRPLRTKITFIDAEADKKMNQFKNSFHSLFALSHSRYYASESEWLQWRPESPYADFLDVEWEFVKGTTEEEWVQSMLIDCAADPQQVLSVAFCYDSADVNFSQSLQLPQQLYSGYDDVRQGDLGEDYTNIYVYQPSSASLARAAQTEVMHLRNLIPFGEQTEEYDLLMSRQTAVAKRVSYLYQKENSGKQFVAMPTDAVLLDTIWQQLSLAEKMSLIYSATTVSAKMRCIGLQSAEALLPIKDSERVEALSRIEHARWIMEKLLLGFGAMPISRIDGLNSALESDDPEVRQEARTYTNRNTNQLYLLKDLAPYSHLPESTKADIRTIVCNLPLAALPHISSVEG